MKNLLFFVLALLISPLLAGPYCIDNSEHLAKSDDHKEWHSVACDCSCDLIKNGYCTECGHLQDARTFKIIKRTVVSAQEALQMPENPQDVLKKLVARYVQKKYDV